MRKAFAKANILNTSKSKEKAFTIMELIVVVIIIGVLAAVAFPMYQKWVEKGRAAEGYNNLGLIRKAQVGYYNTYGVYGEMSSLDTEYDLGLPYCASSQTNCSNNKNHFIYQCTNGASDIYCRAYRCLSGGKHPDALSAYYLKLDLDTGEIVWYDGEE